MIESCASDLKSNFVDPHNLANNLTIIGSRGRLDPSASPPPSASSDSNPPPPRQFSSMMRASSSAAIDVSLDPTSSGDTTHTDDSKTSFHDDDADDDADNDDHSHNNQQRRRIPTDSVVAGQLGDTGDNEQRGCLDSEVSIESSLSLSKPRFQNGHCKRPTTTTTTTSQKSIELRLLDDQGCWQVNTVNLYTWPEPAGEMYIVQDQLTSFMQHKAFKRKYTSLKRRKIGSRERLFLQKNGFLLNPTTSSGLTAVRADDVLVAIADEFPHQFKQLDDELLRICSDNSSSSTKQTVNVQNDDITSKTDGKEPVKLDFSGLFDKVKSSPHQFSNSSVSKASHKAKKQSSPDKLSSLHTSSVTLCPRRPNHLHLPQQQQLQQQQRHSKNAGHKSAATAKREISACKSFNSRLQLLRRDRSSCFNLQTMHIDYPSSGFSVQSSKLTKMGSFPVSLLPGQYTDSCPRWYSSKELFKLPFGSLIDRNYAYDAVVKKQNDGASDTIDNGQTVTDSGDLLHSNNTVTDNINNNINNNNNNVKHPLPSCQPDLSTTNPTPTTIDVSEQCVLCRHSLNNSCCNSNNNNNTSVIDDMADECKSRATKPMVKCASCSSLAHVSCLEMNDEMAKVVTTYDWQCMNCKICSKCSNSTDEEKMMFCDRCDRGFHTYCVGLQDLPNGSWNCAQCGQGTKRLANNNNNNKNIGRQVRRSNKNGIEEPRVKVTPPTTLRSNRRMHVNARRRKSAKLSNQPNGTGNLSPTIPSPSSGVAVATSPSSSLRQTSKRLTRPTPVITTSNSNPDDSFANPPSRRRPRRETAACTSNNNNNNNSVNSICSSSATTTTQRLRPRRT